MTSRSSAAFYDSIALRYDTMLNRLPGDRWVRDAFLNLVRKTVKPGSPLLDFGCGTGTDAAWYAQHGYRVTAYDHSAEMLNQLRKKFPEEIRHGLIGLLSGDWDSFVLGVKSLPPHDAVVCDFAVVNEIPDLEPFFGTLADCLSPNGVVILSVLNPLRHGSAVLAGTRNRLDVRDDGSNGELEWPNMDIYLYPVREIEAAARSCFRMVRRVSAGTFIHYDNGEYSWDRPVGLSAHLEKKLWTIPPFSGMGKFLFMVFRKKK